MERVVEMVYLIIGPNGRVRGVTSTQDRANQWTVGNEQVEAWVIDQQPKPRSLPG